MSACDPKRTSAALPQRYVRFAPKSERCARSSRRRPPSAYGTDRRSYGRSAGVLSSEYNQRTARGCSHEMQSYPPHRHGRPFPCWTARGAIQGRVQDVYQTSWGRAADRFAAAIKYRTKGRIQITNYFDGRASGGAQTTEFQLLQEGVVDFSIRSTINWSPQVKELNLFALPFMFPSYSALDAVEAGDPGKRLFNLIEQKRVIPIAWVQYAGQRTCKG